MQGLTFSILLATVVVFQNCSEAKFETNAKSVQSEEEERLRQVETTCATGQVQNQTYSINFPSNLNASSTVCQWNSSGDPYENDFVMARNEESKSFELPAGATLCDMSFQIQNQTFEYDDMFFLNFNDVILVSATSWFTGMPVWQGLQTYEWAPINGVAWPPRYNRNSWIYCAGADQGLSTCTVPPSETSGNFNLEYDRSIIQKIGIRGSNSHKFSLVVTGDDNPTVDCRHEALNFSVHVAYVMN